MKETTRRKFWHCLRYYMPSNLASVWAQAWQTCGDASVLENKMKQLSPFCTLRPSICRVLVTPKCQNLSNEKAKMQTPDQRELSRDPEQLSHMIVSVFLQCDMRNFSTHSGSHDDVCACVRVCVIVFLYMWSPNPEFSLTMWGPTIFVRTKSQTLQL